MKFSDLIEILQEQLKEFGDLEVRSDAPGDGSILGVEVVRDTHTCTVRGCDQQHEAAPRAVLMVDSDPMDY